jgi:HD-GYP domain-containing protein (c-di-GMP phosphodiesterase class II)
MWNKNRKPIFDTDLARFGAVVARLEEHPENSRIIYANPIAKKLLGNELLNETMLTIFTIVLGEEQQALESITNLMADQTIMVEGECDSCLLNVYSMIDKEAKHWQASIFDVTASTRAQEGFEYMAHSLARASEVNDDDTGEHIIRINKYSAHLAELHGLDKEFVEDISILAQLHDVGKIHIDPQILKKPGRLSSEEFSLMQKHTSFGAHIIGDHASVAMARDIAIAHHEKWAGGGYPSGLQGEQIPLSARIVSVVDVFDALLSERAYKPAFSPEKVYKIMKEGDDRLVPEEHFDPALLSLFLEHYNEFVALHASGEE